MKNIEWLKKEVSTEMIRLEPHRAEKWSDVKYQTLRDVAQKLDQLEEPEVLSQEWVDNNSVYASHDGVTEEYVHVDDLKNLLVPTISEIETVDITEGQIMDWLDDNDFFHHATAETVLANAVDKGELGYYGTKYSVIEKPVIPKHVAEYLYFAKKQASLIEVLVASVGWPTLKKEFSWIAANDETFARAWLDGYTVEEESLYYALVKGHELVTDADALESIFWNFDTFDGDLYLSNRYSKQERFLTKMTMDEWNELGINDSNADFVKVKE